jgi:hypothetical protein
VTVALAGTVALGCVTPGQGSAAVPAPGGGGVVGFDLARPTQPGAQTKVVSYGPFTVPAARGTEHGQEGMVKNQFRIGVPKPCGNCYVTGMKADLKYPDGRTANIDTGMWLHHMVLFQTGKPDVTCPSTGVGLIGQRFFASGNERSNVSGMPGFGYPVGAASTWVLIYDLMNSNMQAKTVSIQMTFDWVPQSTPGMKPLTPVWLDVNQCLTSEVPARTGSYSYTYTWPSTISGKLMGVGGHVHDGGTYLSVRNNGSAARPRNDLLCNSVARYGGPGYEQPMDHAGGMDHGASMEHISQMSLCMAASADQPVGTVATGDRIRVDAYYDTNLHAQHGTHPVMGIAIAYFATS